MSGRTLYLHIINRPDVPVSAMDPARVGRRLSATARAAGWRLRVTASQPLTAIPPELRNVSVLVGSRPPTEQLRDLRQLRWIHLTSAGVDGLLPLDCLPGHVILTNSSGVHAELAGEFARCALLMLNIHFPRHIDNQRRRQRQPIYYAPLRGKTVVVVGLGALGGAAARKAKHAGLRVIGIRRTPAPHRFADEVYGPDRLDEALGRADFLVVAAPLTEETRGMIGRRELDCLRPSAGVVCMSRGGLLDFPALAAKLRAGELCGAIVDVTDPEPLPPDADLWSVPSLVITPHIPCNPPDYPDRVTRLLRTNLKKLLSGEPLVNVVDRVRGY